MAAWAACWLAAACIGALLPVSPVMEAAQELEQLWARAAALAGTAEAEARLARAEAEAAAAERTETLQRVERPLQSQRQLQAAVASLRELTRQAPPAEGPGSSRDRNGLLAPLY
jgi:hypothetical protein